ncbi:ketosteroid isomerase-like protein [Polymorphobacter multimanifer]|uniref:Ketosteroid isomerase-like protein n=1 Tax=Polymorphobacter multimanifer TaxID=1070431 RepID=A0A841L8A5_9SPHN|nr:ketosteroid isomerase-like protein [Polymorphobacter multimanifer]
MRSLLTALTLLAATPATADDVAEIRTARASYNAAILNRDAATISALFGPGYKGLAGSGGELIDSGPAMTAYFVRAFKNPAFITFERTPEVITIAERRERAMERGTWLGRSLTPDGDEDQLVGEYLAVWVPTPTGWKLRSESFVTLARREVPVSPNP